MPEVSYFMTQTLRPTLYKLKVSQQHEKIFKEIKYAVRRYSKYAMVVPELTKKCNMHYHMIVKFEDDLFKIQFVDHMRKIGFYDLQILKNEQKCMNYMMKDVHNTREILSSAENEIPFIYKASSILVEQMKLISKPIDISECQVSQGQNPQPPHPAALALDGVEEHRPSEERSQFQQEQRTQVRSEEQQARQQPECSQNLAENSRGFQCTSVVFCPCLNS